MGAETGKDVKADVTGLSIARPDAPCTDGNCPFHGRLRLHGRRLSGTVSSAKMRRTANIVIERTAVLKKYDRHERRRSKLKVHNPECLSAKEGDRVDVIECRPLSRTKHFVIVRKY
ncbi:30S ribosomal protein S17 [Candidatus Woesearchaeota archaeon]|nr:30S ribosomal protein S17 [Candidatus Woesearchaeota archaeon]